MGSALERRGICRFVLAMVLAGFSLSAQAKDRLPEIQKAVGKDWLVTALPNGYLLTYMPLVSFYPAISENSKLDDYQREAHGRMDHLRIRVTYLNPPPMEKTDAFNAFWRKYQQGVPGYYDCDNAHWCIELDQPGCALEGRQQMGFSSNVAPDELVPSNIQEDAYEGALDAVAPLIHCVRHDRPWAVD